MATSLECLECVRRTESRKNEIIICVAATEATRSGQRCEAGRYYLRFNCNKPLSSEKAISVADEQKLRDAVQRKANEKNEPKPVTRAILIA